MVLVVVVKLILLCICSIIFFTSIRFTSIRFTKNLEQSKYRKLLETIEPISEEVGYDIIEASNDEINYSSRPIR